LGLGGRNGVEDSGCAAGDVVGGATHYGGGVLAEGRHRVPVRATLSCGSCVTLTSKNACPRWAPED
jgi:hypothetical protein